MPSQLTKNILQTVIFYDILNFPLTSFEIWKYLTVEGEQLEVKDKKAECSLGDIVETLENEDLKKYIEEYNGFFFLKGRQYLVEERIERDKNSIEKYRIAEQAAGWLRFVPYVRMVAITGTMAMKNCEKSSDIDFFVVLEKGRIFTGRLFVTVLVHLLRRRRYGKKIRNRICLNYFVTTGSLEIKKKDLFAANEYSFLYPLLGFGIYRKFAEANAGWIKRYKPNCFFDDIEPFRYVADGKFSSSIRNFLEHLINFLRGDRIEAWLKEKQVVRIERNPLTNIEGAYIEANDENLVFLPEPQGPKVVEKFGVLTQHQFQEYIGKDSNRRAKQLRLEI